MSWLELIIVSNSVIGLLGVTDCRCKLDRTDASSPFETKWNEPKKE